MKAIFLIMVVYLLKIATIFIFQMGTYMDDTLFEFIRKKSVGKLYIYNYIFFLNIREVRVAILRNDC